MAAAAGLALSYSAERSVQDELARESFADLGTARAPGGWALWRQRGGLPQATLSTARSALVHRDLLIKVARLCAARLVWKKLQYACTLTACARCACVTQACLSAAFAIHFECE
jgi:hypothetical protein